MPGPNTFPTSTLQLGTLAEYDAPSLLDIRPILGSLSGPAGYILRTAFEQVQAAFDNIQQTLRSASPGLQYLQIDAADIAVLAVGGQYGPGEFTVYNGGPNFDPIGWIGSRANASSVAITSIIAGLVTTAAPHGLKVGDNVYVEATTDPLNTGFYVVATTPTNSTYTVTGGVAGGNSTGGDMTLQYQGGWLKMFAVGGTSPADAPFRVDVDGTLSITDALITLSGTDGSIVLDPTTNPPRLLATDALTGDTIELLPGIGLIQSSGVPGVDPGSIWDVSEFHFTNSSHRAVATLKSDTGATEAGSLNLQDSGGTATVQLDPSNATAILTTGGGAISSSGALLVGTVVSTYNAGATAGMGVPPIYASVALANQSGSIGTTPLKVGGAIAPSGRYRVTWHTACRTAGTGNVVTTLSWNDGISARTSAGTIPLTAGTFQSIIIPLFQSDGINNITFSTTYSATGAYDIYVTLERMS